MKQKTPMGASIYVLGGNQESLILRFREAAILHQRGFADRILILSRPGITEYNTELGRNLTNNEWAIRELGKLNVKKEDIDPVSVKDWTLGTLSEAHDLPGIVRKKGSDKLILVTSAYHTRRTYIAFSKFASNNNIELYIYGSDDIQGLGSLLFEYMKLFLYENVALPVSGWRKTKAPVQTPSFFS